MENTRLCPYMIEPTHVCAQTRLYADLFVPRLVCAHADTFVPTVPHTFVPRKICDMTCYNRVVTFISGHIFCALTCYEKIRKYSSRNTAGDC